MKQFLTFFVFIISISAHAQKRSYVQIGATGYIDTKGTNSYWGGGLGAGTGKGFGSAGINIELITGEKKYILPVYADVRFYFSPRTSSIYATLQPGYNFRNNPITKVAENVTEKDRGGFYGAIGMGLFIFDKKAPGFNFQVKYVFMQNKITHTDHNGGTYIIRGNTHPGYISLCASVVI